MTMKDGRVPDGTGLSQAEPSSGLGPSRELYPAYIRDNPVMRGAFAAFMDWLWRKPEAHDAFCGDTGHAPLPKFRSPLGAMIDEATGFTTAYAGAFTRWAIDTQWGVEGRDDCDSDGSGEADETAKQGSAAGDSAGPKDIVHD